jgi:hypothetical protein
MHACVNKLKLRKAASSSSLIHSIYFVNEGSLALAHGMSIWNNQV